MGSELKFLPSTNYLSFLQLSSAFLATHLFHSIAYLYSSRPLYICNLSSYTCVNIYIYLCVCVCVHLCIPTEFWDFSYNHTCLNDDVFKLTYTVVSARELQGHLFPGEVILYLNLMTALTPTSSVRQIFYFKGPGTFL